MPAKVIDALKNDLVGMAEMCESALDTSVMALMDRDESLALYVINYDREIDEIELSIDRRCLQLMQTKTIDESSWRMLIAISKISTFLERIGDLAVEISEHVLFLIRERSVMGQVIDFDTMVEQISQMVRESVASLMALDVELAWKIIDERQVADEERHVIYRELLDVMQKDGRTIERAIHLLFISQNLQRVADQASNVAEEVVYMVEGVRVRHHLREFHPVKPLPFGTEDTQEVFKRETSVLEKRKPREEIRKEAAEAREAIHELTPREIEEEAAAAGKVSAAREKLLKLRSKKKGNG